LLSFIYLSFIPHIHFLCLQAAQSCGLCSLNLYYLSFWSSSDKSRSIFGSISRLSDDFSDFSSSKQNYYLLLFYLPDFYLSVGVSWDLVSLFDVFVSSSVDKVSFLVSYFSSNLFIKSKSLF